MFEKDSGMYLSAGRSKNTKERISTSEVCLSHADIQIKEPTQQHDIGDTLLSNIGAGSL